MIMKNLVAKLDKFLNPEDTETKKKETNEDFLEVKEKDGIIERVNKKFIAEDGRQILMD